ncbi:hypothetical protein [Haloglomus salinum]|jgi:hypothetical protein|uniref:hypothetical protein n=1 Tax=Haloglomus salinum TaxID=2962673 RepID=UPI0020C9E736|nr:hypothetical protein [Haloglomus salinum]
MVRRVAAVGARIPWGGAADDQHSAEASTDDPTSDADRPPTEAEDTTDDPPLETVSERRTLADVVDVAALTRWLPTAWTARTAVTKFGEAPVTEVLELSGRGHRVVVDPQRPVAPEGPATCYARPAGTARRREVATTDSLHEALAIALDRIPTLDEHVDPVLPAERRATGLSEALDTSAGESR